MTQQSIVSTDWDGRWDKKPKGYQQSSRLLKWNFNMEASLSEYLIKITAPINNSSLFFPPAISAFTCRRATLGWSSSPNFSFHPPPMSHTAPVFIQRKWKIGSRCRGCHVGLDYETRACTSTARETFIEKSQELPYISLFWPHLTF